MNMKRDVQVPKNIRRQTRCQNNLWKLPRRQAKKDQDFKKDPNKTIF